MGFKLSSPPRRLELVLPSYTLDLNLVLLPGIVYNVSFLRFKAATLLLRYQGVVPDLPLIKSLLSEYDFGQPSLGKPTTRPEGYPGRMSKEASDGVKKFNRALPEENSSDYDDFILAITPNFNKIFEPEEVKAVDALAKENVATVVRIIGITDDTTTVRITFQALNRALKIAGHKGKANELKVWINTDTEVPLLKQEFVTLCSSVADLFTSIDNFVDDYREAFAASTLQSKNARSKNDPKENSSEETPDGDLLILNPLANALYLQLAASKDFTKAFTSLRSIYAEFEAKPSTLDSQAFLRLIDLTTAIIPFPSFQKLTLLLKQLPTDRVQEIANMIHVLIDVFESIEDNNHVLNHWFFKEASNPQKAALVANQLKSIRLVLEGMASKLTKPTSGGSTPSQSNQLVRKSRNGTIPSGNFRPTRSGPEEEDGEDDDDLRVITNFFKNQLPQIVSIAPDSKRLLLKDYKRIKTSPPGNLDFQVIRNYLEIVADMPWDRFVTSYQSNKDIDIQAARAQLDKDHYGLDHVKNRLIQYLVVLKLLAIREELQEDKKSASEKSNHLVKDPSSSNPSIIIDRADETKVANAAAIKQNEISKNEIQKGDDDVGKSPGNMDHSLKHHTSGKAPIILLAGPPGTGKTSLAKSIAELLGRKFQRVALGGVRDEAEIRGHRRTYVGAMPGVIVQALRKLRSMNPVILLDEIDKVIGGGDGGMRAHGDPAAALLEVLDPEQNTTFNDHYLGFPVDLSQVIFVCTANEPYNLSRPLLDRLEMIEVGAYDYDEKAIIGRKYLLPRQIKRNGFPDDKLIDISNEVMQKIIVNYTREAGVRNFERKLGTVCRYKAVEYAKGLEDKTTHYNPVVDISSLPKYLGIPYSPFSNELQEPFQSDKFGVINGLSYNTDGSGSVLVFESIGFPADKFSLNMTGRLGEVLMESAKIGATFVKLILNRNLLNLEPNLEGYLEKLSKLEIHLHVPSGAISKDGPSAGITMALLFLSLVLEKPVPSDIAMTGEITLRGSVLPIGGVKEKLLGAHFNGMKRVILPRENRKDIIKEYCHGINDDSKLNDLLIDNERNGNYQMREPEEYYERKMGIKLHYASEFWDVIRAVWGPDLLIKVEQARVEEYHL